jgi:hypothetical protein
MIRVNSFSGVGVAVVPSVQTQTVEIVAKLTVGSRISAAKFTENQFEHGSDQKKNVKLSFSNSDISIS